MECANAVAALEFQRVSTTLMSTDDVQQERRL